MKFEDIKELIKVFDESKIDKIELKNGDFEISMKKGLEKISKSVTSTIATSQVEEINSAVNENESTIKSNETSKGELIKSPMVGTFYAAPAPDAPPFVNVGDTVKKGQTLCILEAMKIMNELEAEFDCKILEILVEDGQAVEYDMPLFKVERI